MPTEDKNLRELLEKQVSDYLAALELERELGRLLQAQDAAGIEANTESKRLVMAEINARHEVLLPLLGRNRGADGALRDPGSESLRQRARKIIEEILELERSNAAAVADVQNHRLEELSQARKARQMAGGYKPSRKERPSRYFDKKG